MDGFVFSLGSVGEEVMEKCNIAWLLKRARHAGATGELCFIDKMGLELELKSPS